MRTTHILPNLRKPTLSPGHFPFFLCVSASQRRTQRRIRRELRETFFRPLGHGEHGDGRARSILSVIARRRSRRGNHLPRKPSFFPSAPRVPVVETLLLTRNTPCHRPRSPTPQSYLHSVIEGFILDSRQAAVRRSAQKHGRQDGRGRTSIQEAGATPHAARSSECSTAVSRLHSHGSTPRGREAMPDIHKRYAVVVGVSDYDDEIPELPNAKNDAYRLHSVLQEFSGFTSDQVYLLANGSDPSSHTEVLSPTKPIVLQKLQYVCDNAGPDDLILLYFAGHGVEMSKTPYLITSDTRMDVLSETALDVGRLNAMLESSGCRCVLRFFDACRSPFAQGRGALDRMTAGLQEAVMKCAKGWASFSSCSSGEVAHELGEVDQGVFTYYLCEGLSGKAANQGGEISIEGLVAYVKTSVGNWCDRQTQMQTPHFQADLSGSLVLGTSTSLPEVDSAPPGSPFGELLSGIDQHLSSTTDDTRRLTFTSLEEWTGITKSLDERLAAKLDEFSHPAINVQVRTMDKHKRGTISWEVFHQDLVAHEIAGEFTNHSAVCEVHFVSSEVVVPTTKLYVVLARFNFFYWLWYCHECVPGQLQEKFKPDPPYTKGFFTFKPSAARDADKLDRSLTELLTRSSREILTWAKQLGEYVESRVNPLRRTGHIIE